MHQRATAMAARSAFVGDIDFWMSAHYRKHEHCLEPVL
jgi:hypothetical protein